MRNGPPRQHEVENCFVDEEMAQLILVENTLVGSLNADLAQSGLILLLYIREKFHVWRKMC